MKMSGLRHTYRGLKSIPTTRQLSRAVANGTQQLLPRPRPTTGVRNISSASTWAQTQPTKIAPASVRHASSSSSSLNKTQLYDLHLAHGAKMVPFAGYDMPLQYSDLSHVDSHQWTREKASLFDVSHMVQHRLTGPGALPLLQKVTPSSLDKLGNNQSTLSCLLEDGTGGIVDDTVITRLGPESFYFVTNAGRREEDLAFLTAEIDAYRTEYGPDTIKWEILSDRALVALQGPLAASVLQSFIYTDGEDPASSDLNTLYFGQSRELYLKLADGSKTAHKLLISRTGYTGEDGFEISIPTSGSPSLPAQVTELLLSQPDQVRLAGLAARDSLRLEAGMCLYGHDISTAHTPPVAALGWVVGKERRDASSPASQFNGSSVILPQLASPSKTISQRRVGFTIEKGAPAREGAIVVDPNDSKVQIGVITSGLPSPSLGGTNIAMGYIKQGLHKKGTGVAVLVRNKLRKATVTSMPWVESKFHRPT
ncbi:hypothetical protein BGW36DRAFT_319688 [Talaromyces proteolyticus]|uniref:Aminomethyltransferase n=1 Tax=Talaromyces proteolyticus TaxID=1131652 RepID=A0AAD4Q0L8_9EURO|nr:uncharacterized protein BGW36DRAFT_319688 [Talaromyces proteolyticus]KAH8697323.1 hypothetical protein BGW36DRAFT_319688 [Talaromyces proteolyticus]